MSRRKLALAAAALLVLSACAARPAHAWRPEQAEAAAWWVEDIAHGRARDPGELDFVGAGERPARIARWAAGHRIDGRWQPPLQLERRRARWPQLARLIAEGAVVATEEGFLAPAAGLPPERRAEVEALVEAENAARLLVDQLLLALGAPDPEVERSYRRAVRAARVALDRGGD